MADDPNKQFETILKRVADLSGTATKVGLLGLIALAIVWTSEVRPAYETLIREGYDKAEATFSTTDGLSLSSAGPPPSRRERKEAASKRAEVARNVSFDVGGIKVPVPTLWASVVLSLLLAGTLAYLSTARRKIWSLLGTAHLRLRSLNRPLNDDDDAGGGPLWLAPAPEHEIAEALRWRGLNPVPNIFISVVFALLVVLQFDVVGYSCRVLIRAATAQQRVESIGVPTGAIGEFADLLLPPWLAASVGAVLILLVLTTLGLVARWLWPVDVTKPMSTRAETYQQTGAAIVAFLLLAGLAALCAHRWPQQMLDGELHLGKMLLWLRPPVIAIIAFVVAGVLLCLAWRRVRVHVLSGGPTVQSAPPSSVITRRRLLVAGAVMATLSAVAVVANAIIFRKPVTGQSIARRVRRRMRLTAEAWTAAVMPDGTPLPVGFYARGPRQNPGASVTRANSTRSPGFYVTHSLTPPRVVYSNVSRKTVGLLTVPRTETGSNGPTVLPSNVVTNPVRVSAIFELAAIDALRADPQRAAAILVEGIRRDLQLKRRTRGGPSIRLFDLLARVIARHRLTTYQSVFEKLADEARAGIETRQRRASPAQRSSRGKRAHWEHRNPSASISEQRARQLTAFDKRRQRWRTINADQPRPWTMVRPDDVKEKGRYGVKVVVIV
jgi:hypothetical protein